MTARLVTIGVSHFCEKARWAVERAGVPFREERHAPVFHIAVARLLGGGTTPVLVNRERTLTDSTGILRWVDEATPAARRLYPDDPGSRTEVERMEDRFDRDLGPATRRVAYYHLLDEPGAYGMLVDGLGGLERGMFRVAFPLCRKVMERALRVDAAGAERSGARIAAVFDELDGLLADGRRHLVGDRFTAADLSFAALAAPVLFPVEYGFPLIPLDETPPAFRQAVARYRDTATGRFALRIYAEQRRGPSGARPSGTPEARRAPDPRVSLPDGVASSGT